MGKMINMVNWPRLFGQALSIWLLFAGG